MELDWRKKHKTWIKEFLAPNLIKEQKLIVCKKTSEHIELKSIEIKEMSLEVAFMLTACYFVKISVKIAPAHIQCESDASADKNEFDLVVKFGPETDPETYENMSMQSLFSNEIIAYEYIIPKLEYMSKSPKYYYSHNKFLDAVIVLSDFTVDGWKMSQSKVNLSLDHILTSVKQLGQFHGNMYALKLTDVATFNSIKNKLVSSRYCEGGCVSPEWNMWMELGIRRATASVRASKDAQSIVPEAFLKRLEAVMYGAYEYRRKRLQPIEPIATICHGDYLRNNIAFRYDSNGTAIEALMFDFQTLCYSSPMIDLATFMANSTGWKIRNEHFWDIFRTYHESLITNFLASTKWNENQIPDFLSYDKLLEEYARYLPFGIAVATTFLQTLHEISAPNYDETRVEEIFRLIFDKGGEIVDEELRSLVVHTYKLYEKLNLTLEKL